MHQQAGRQGTHYANQKKGRIEIYQERVERGVDIWTGRELTNEQVRHASLCSGCWQWFWTESINRSFCSRNCEPWKRPNPPPMPSVEQILSELAKL